MNINRRQRKILKDFISSGHVYNYFPYLDRWIIDNWTDYRITKGSVCDSLIAAGLLEEVNFSAGEKRIRLTSFGEKFRCRKCHQGTLYKEGTDELIECSDCEGVGVLLKVDIESPHSACQVH